MSARNPFRIASVGHAAFALSIIALGVMGLMRRSFVPVWTGFPHGVPARIAFVYLTAFISLAGGIGLFWRNAAALASRVILTYLVLWMLLFRLPLIVRAPASPVNWWACGETAVMIAGAWVLYTWFGADGSGKRFDFPAGERGLRIARVLYGLGVIAFGAGHFTFLERTVSMVPGWLPWHLGWAYFTGGALIAAGFAIIIGLFARLAATLAAWELTLFTVLVWVPVIVKSADASQWDEFIDSCALTACAWLVAESFRGTPWRSSGLLGTRRH